MTQPESSHRVSRPSFFSLVSLVVLGGLSASWSAFLWRQLITARSGGTPFCGFGEGVDCGSLWDSPFASTIHRLTGLPVAGWGLVWGLAALALAAFALFGLRRGKAMGVGVGALRAVSLVGILVVGVLAAVSARAGIFCFGCLVSYVLTAAYAGVVLFGGRGVPGWGAGTLGRGMVAAGAPTLVFYLAFLSPGLRTPRSVGEAGRKAITSMPAAAASEGVEPAAGSPSSAPTAPSDTAGAEHDPFADALIAQFIASLKPQMAQVLSDALYAYKTSPIVPAPPARSILGSTAAPVRITDFTDALCPACADLHSNFEVFAMSLSPGSFNLEPRHFPLDARCNALLGGEPREEETRCLAAKARICMEGRPEAAELARALFAEQQDLDIEKVYALAELYLGRAALTACVESDETAAKLREDIDYAATLDIDGTPMVLVNGRKADAFGPFLYTLILAQGDATYPAFGALPPAVPGAREHRH